MCAQAGLSLCRKINILRACVFFYWDSPWVRRRTLARRGRPNPSSLRWMLFSRWPLWRSSSLAGRPPCRRAPRTAPAAAPQAPPPAAEGCCWILNRKMHLIHTARRIQTKRVFAQRENQSKQNVKRKRVRSIMQRNVFCCTVIEALAEFSAIKAVMQEIFAYFSCKT